MAGSAQAEAQLAALREVLDGLRVRDAMVVDPIAVPGAASIDAFMTLVFAGSRHTAYPVAEGGLAAGRDRCASGGGDPDPPTGPPGGYVTSWRRWRTSSSSPPDQPLPADPTNAAISSLSGQGRGSGNGTGAPDVSGPPAPRILA